MIKETTELFPHWRDCKNAIAVGCSDLYAPYLAVYIESIKENALKNQTYDIVVLESDITDRNKEKLLDTISGYTNISLRFYNVNYLFETVNLPILYAYFSKHCYYRLAVGRIFSKYNKVLFTDIDLAIAKNFDINSMFSINLKGKAIAAVEEILWTKENRKGKIQLNWLIDDYIINEVKCSDKYFNTGVMLVDIKTFNQVASFETLLQIAMEHKFINQEQCVLNQVFDGKIYALPLYYNFEVYEGIFKSTRESFVEYMSQINKAKIYHYLTNKKVWFYPELPMGELWWKYARQTPFYEEILARMVKFQSGNKPVACEVPQLRNELAKTHFPNINNHFAANEAEMRLLYVLNHLFYFRCKKFWYACKKAFAFGKRYDKYNQKYSYTKKTIKDAKHLSKTLRKI